MDTDPAPRDVNDDSDAHAEERLTCSVSELAAAFTEWDRRYREEPERFMSEATHLLRETPETYGDACAPYLLSILEQLRDAG